MSNESVVNFPKTLRLTLHDNYPLVDYSCRQPRFHSDENCQRPGLLMEIPTDNENFFQSMVSNLIHNKTDLYGGFFELTDSRLENHSFSDPLYKRMSNDSHIEVPKTLRIIIIENYPMTNFECRQPSFRPGKNCRRPGLVMEIFRLIAGTLNIRINTSFEQPTNSFEDGFQRAFSNLQQNITDVYGSLFEESKIRKDHFAFSEPLYESHTKIVVRRTDHSLKSIFDFFTVYNYQSWLIMIFMFLLFTSFGLGVRYLEWRLRLRPNWDPAVLIFKMVRLQLIQPDPIDYKFLSGSASLITFTLLQIGVIVGIYESWVLSSVIKSKDPFPFRPEELTRVLKEKKYFIVTSSQHEWVFNEIETSYISPFFELREAIKDNPIITVKTAEEALQMTQQTNALIIMPDDQLITFLAEKYCDLVYMPSPIPPNKERFMFSKNSPFVKPFNRAIQENQVFIQRLYRKYIISRPPSNCTQSDRRPVALTLNPYYGPLFLFFIGISTACFAFSGEIWSYWMKKRS